MFLETERLILRKFRESDLDDFCLFAMDDERNRLMGNAPVLTEEDARESLDWFLYNEPRAYALVLKETDKVIGNITVYELAPDTLTGEKGMGLSFSVSRGNRRRGLMEEALRALIDRLFRDEDADYVMDDYFDYNVPSRELHRKLGFEDISTEKVTVRGECVTDIVCILRRSGFYQNGGLK